MRRWLLALAFLAAPVFAVEPTSVSTVTATGQYTVPAGICQITAECIGSGGGGASSTAGGKAGGSGGMYASTGPITTSAGTIYAVKIGSAGASTTGGGPTMFGSSICWAAGGLSPGANGTTGASPFALTLGTGSVKCLGGYGHSFVSGAYGAGGGSAAGRATWTTCVAGNFTTLANASDQSGGADPDGAGPAGAGGTGPTTNAAGNAGAAYGSGGSGAYQTSSTKAGGPGTLGVITVQEYACPAAGRRPMVIN